MSIPNSNPCPQCGAAMVTGPAGSVCPRCAAGMLQGTQTALGERSPGFAPPPLEEIAAKFPNLEILEILGRGGMGAVYKARQKQLDRLVALKILPPDIGHRAAFAERFAREARALARLQHSHIVTLYEFGESGGLFYFLMEFVDGVNLRQLLQSGRIAPKEALAIVPQICDALQFAHDRGIVHRDIKPENILLGKDGQVKIADFGIAKIMTGDLAASAEPSPANPAHTQAGNVLGTPQYMAPEQITAPLDVDHRADIYALGVVFYQMLTGELPQDRLEAPSRKVQLDVRLDEIVLRALQKEPALRWQQASVLKTQVETMLLTPTAPAPQVTPAPVDRPRFSGMAIAGIACVPIFLFGLFSYSTTICFSFGISGILLTTIFGAIALSQIRRHPERFHGLWLAVTDVLLFPLLLLDGLLIFLFDLAGKAIAQPLSEGAVATTTPALGPIEEPIQIISTQPENFFVEHRAYVVPAIAILVALLVDWRIIRRVWRALKPSSSTRSQPNLAVLLLRRIAVSLLLVTTLTFIGWRIYLGRKNEPLANTLIPAAHLSHQTTAERLHSVLRSALKSRFTYTRLDVEVSPDGATATCRVIDPERMTMVDGKAIHAKVSGRINLTRTAQNEWRIEGFGAFSVINGTVSPTSVSWNGPKEDASWAYQYTPLIECAVNQLEQGGWDLETGGFVAALPGMALLPTSNGEWESQAGIDIIPDPQRGGLQFIGGAIQPINPAAWEKSAYEVLTERLFSPPAQPITPYEHLAQKLPVAHLLSSSGFPDSSVEKTAPFGTLAVSSPVTTYLFCTAQGSAGLLRVLSGNDLMTLRVQSKLIRNAFDRTSILDTPPALHAYAELDDYLSVPARIRSPGGQLFNSVAFGLPKDSSVLSAETLGKIKVAGDPSRYLCLWFAHEGIDERSLAQLTLLDPRGQPLSDPAKIANELNVFPASDSLTPRRKVIAPELHRLEGIARNARGWFTATAFSGAESEITARLRYSLGPWQPYKSVPASPTLPFELAKGVRLTAIDRQPNGFLSVRLERDPRKDAGNTQFDVCAEVKSGSDIIASTAAKTSDGEGVENYIFDIPPNAEILSFSVRQRPIHQTDYSLKLRTSTAAGFQPMLERTIIYAIDFDTGTVFPTPAPPTGGLNWTSSRGEDLMSDGKLLGVYLKEVDSAAWWTMDSEEVQRTASVFGSSTNLTRSIAPGPNRDTPPTYVFKTSGPVVVGDAVSLWSQINAVTGLLQVLGKDSEGHIQLRYKLIQPSPPPKTPIAPAPPK